MLNAALLVILNLNSLFFTQLVGTANGTVLGIVVPLAIAEEPSFSVSANKPSLFQSI